ncbi:hypothetical protein AOR13_968 [Alteromonas stellipolaris LMG 21856]|nr:hypothetical protein AOR13_968 [Alteromonas stellipolaris LMG 21856]
MGLITRDWKARNLRIMVQISLLISGDIQRKDNTNDTLN